MLNKQKGIAVALVGFDALALNDGRRCSFHMRSGEQSLGSLVVRARLSRLPLIGDGEHSQQAQGSILGPAASNSR